jgi:hypothetical protein
MTLTIASRVQNKTSGNEGTIDDIEVVLTNAVRLRYFKVVWDKTFKLDPKYYLEQELIEKLPLNLQFANENTNYRRIRISNSVILNKRKFMTELDIVRFLNPRIPDVRLQLALESSLNLFKKPSKNSAPSRNRYMRAKFATRPKLLTIDEPITPPRTGARSNPMDLTMSSDDEDSRIKKVFKTKLWDVRKSKHSSSASNAGIVDLTLSSDSDENDSDFEIL